MTIGNWLGLALAAVVAIAMWAKMRLDSYRENRAIAEREQREAELELHQDQAIAVVTRRERGGRRLRLLKGGDR